VSELSRRRLFAACGSLGALGLVAACTGSDDAPPGGATSAASPSAQPPLPSEAYRIDLHAHALPPVYQQALTSAGLTLLDGLPVPKWSPELALQFMTAHGIQAQVLSISTPQVTFLSGSSAVDAAREVNRYLGQLSRDQPRSFAALAVLPLPDVPAAVREARRALDEDGLQGVAVLSNHNGVYLGDPRFDPLWEELNGRGTYVYLHPEAPQQFPDIGIFPAAMEFVFDTTRSLATLAQKDVFRRFPNIRWQVAHSGGTVPFLASRISLAVPGFRETIQRLRYDTALSANEAAQAALRSVVGLDNIVFGSDFPFATVVYPPSGDPQPDLSASYSNTERLKLERENALREFPRLAQVLRA
jgi:6-methylsalicylate decarboxylase